MQGRARKKGGGGGYRGNSTFAVRITKGLTHWFPINFVVRQDICLSSLLFITNIGKITTEANDNNIEIRISSNGAQLKPVSEFKYFRSIFTQDGRMDRAIETRILWANSVTKHSGIPTVPQEHPNGSPISQQCLSNYTNISVPDTNTEQEKKIIAGE